MYIYIYTVYIYIYIERERERYIYIYIYIYIFCLSFVNIAMLIISHTFVYKPCARHAEHLSPHQMPEVQEKV